MMEEESVLSQRYRIFFGWDNKRGLFVTFYTQWGRTECSWIMGRVLLLWAFTQLWKIVWCCIVIQKLCYHLSHPNLQSSFNSRFTAQSRFISHLKCGSKEKTLLVHWCEQIRAPILPNMWARLKSSTWGARPHTLPSLSNHNWNL